MNVTERLADLVRTELELAGLSDLNDAIANFVRGTPEETAVGWSVIENLRRTFEMRSLGLVTDEELKYVAKQSRLGLLALSEAKLTRIEVAVVDAFFRILLVLIPRV